MNQVAISDFRARCSRLLDELQRTGVPLLITKRGEPVARVVSVSGEQVSGEQMSGEHPRVGTFGCMAGTFEIVGDLVDSTWLDE